MDLSELQKLPAYLNRDPNPAEIKTNPHAGNSQYLPISFIEMELDEIFFGIWETKKFQTAVIGNEITGSIELRVFHPTLKIWITRTGAAATMIRQQANAGITEADKKIKNALEMDYPHLKADCIRNAAASFGKRFGRDLNRKFTDNYKALLQQQNVESGVITAENDLSRLNDRRRSDLMLMLERCRIDEDKVFTNFEMRIKSATDNEFGQIRAELEMYLPSDIDTLKQRFNK